MLKYCNGCERDLEVDKFYSYKKSTCKQCINKKIKCDYCDKEFNSTNLSKHIKQIHSTSNTNDSTSNKTDKNNSTSNKTDKNISTSNKTDKNNSTSNKTDKNISTSNKTDENNDTLYPTIGDSLYLNKFFELNKDKIYDTKTRNQINRILTKIRILHDKIKNKNITIGEQKQYENNLCKLRELDYVDERVCKIVLKYKYLD